jgi:hypothetical protein
MGNLIDCLKKAGKLISPDEAKALKRAVKEYRKSGRTPEEAERLAVQAEIDDISAKIDDVYKQAGVVKPEPKVGSMVEPTAGKPERPTMSKMDTSGEPPPSAKELEIQNLPPKTDTGMYWESSSKLIEMGKLDTVRHFEKTVDGTLYRLDYKAEGNSIYYRGVPYGEGGRYIKWSDDPELVASTIYQFDAADRVYDRNKIFLKNGIKNVALATRGDIEKEPLFYKDEMMPVYPAIYYAEDANGHPIKESLKHRFNNVSDAMDWAIKYHANDGDLTVPSIYTTGQTGSLIADEAKLIKAANGDLKNDGSGFKVKRHEPSGMYIASHPNGTETKPYDTPQEALEAVLKDDFYKQVVERFSKDEQAAARAKEDRVQLTEDSPAEDLANAKIVSNTRRQSVTMQQGIYSEDHSLIVGKETFSNAVDATRDLPDGAEKNIFVGTNGGNFVIADNGPGMTQIVMHQKLMTGGESGKDAASGVGGFGAAKQTIFLSPYFRAVSIAKNSRGQYVATTIENNRGSFLDAQEDGMPVDLSPSGASKWQSLTKDGNMKMRFEYLDEADGPIQTGTALELMLHLPRMAVSRVPCVKLTSKNCPM